MTIDTRLVLLLISTHRNHDMDTFSTLLALCEGNWTITDGFPHKRRCVRIFYSLSYITVKQTIVLRWLKTPWRSCDVTVMHYAGILLLCPLQTLVLEDFLHQADLLMSNFLQDGHNCGLRMPEECWEVTTSNETAGLMIPACIPTRAWPLSGKRHIEAWSVHYISHETQLRGIRWICISM